MSHKKEFRDTILKLYDGKKSCQEIQDVLHLLYPDDDFHSIDVQ